MCGPWAVIYSEAFPKELPTYKFEFAEEVCAEQSYLQKSMIPRKCSSMWIAWAWHISRRLTRETSTCSKASKNLTLVRQNSGPEPEKKCKLNQDHGTQSLTILSRFWWILKERHSIVLQVKHEPVCVSVTTGLFDKWDFHPWSLQSAQGKSVVHTNVIPWAFGAVEPQQDMLLPGSSGPQASGGASWHFGHPPAAGCL